MTAHPLSFTESDLAHRAESIDAYRAVLGDDEQLARVTSLLDLWMIAEVTVTVDNEPTRTAYLAYPSWDMEPLSRWTPYDTAEAARAAVREVGGKIFEGEPWPRT